MKLTPWYPGDVKPVREGVYERDYINASPGKFYCYWNGKYWGSFYTVPSGAVRYRDIKSAAQNLPWRGVVK